MAGKTNENSPKQTAKIRGAFAIQTLKPQLLCRAGYLHYHLDIANAIAEDEEGLFVGYAKADPQHAERICIYDLQHTERGHINNQTDLYHSLSARKQAAVYGFLLHSEAKGYYGEVCVKVR